VKKKISFLCFLTAIILCACKEDFELYGDLNEEYVLNCILSADSTNQTATITKSYFADFANLNSVRDDPTITGTAIRISFSDSVKIFTQKIVERKDNSRYPDSATIYNTTNFTPQPSTDYIIDAHLPDGRRLRAKTRTPDPISFDLYKCDSLIPMPHKDWIGVYWEPPAEDQYVAAAYKIYYFKKENSQKVRYEKRVPVKYIKKGDAYLPYFPEPSYSPMILVEVDAFARALQEISEGDPNKENYIILAFILEVRIYDRNLTTYYAAQKEVPESFTLKVDESDYSNIEGGLGIFGSFIKQRKAVKFSHTFIEQFGYTPGLTE